MATKSKASKAAASKASADEQQTPPVAAPEQTSPAAAPAPDPATSADDDAIDTSRDLAADVSSAETEPTGGGERRVLEHAEVIARRSADIDSEKAKNDEHVKVFVLPPGPKPTPDNGYDHAANMAATRQYAISQGMRPVGDVRHVSTKQHDNGISWVLTYAVKVAVDDEITRPSEPDIVLPDGNADVNTDKAGHANDTRGKQPNAPTASA